MNRSNIIFGKNITIEKDVEIGYGTDRETVIGDNCILRKGTIIYAGARLGNNVQTGHNTLIREDNIIGDNVRIGSYTELAPRNTIGTNTRIHTGCFLEDTTIGNNVFIGPHVLFTNDPHPSRPQHKNCFKGAIVEDHAIIGGGVTILPHIIIGTCAFIGAGSVVTKDIPSNSVAVGNPAKIIKQLNTISCDKNGNQHNPYEEYPTR